MRFDFKLRKNFVIKLYDLINAKVELINALDILISLDRKRILKAKKSLEKGNSISKSFSYISKNEEFISFISYSEKTGDLLNCLRLLKEKYEFYDNTVSTVISFLIYPIIVIIMSLVISIILLIFVVPKFVQIYDNVELKIPMITRFIIYLSQNLSKNLISISLVILTLSISLAYAIKKNIYLFHKIILKSPIIYLISFLEFTKSTYFLLESNIDLVDSLKIVNIRNKYLRRSVNKVIKNIEKGDDVYRAFNKEKIFTYEFLIYIKILTKTGNIKNSFKNISSIYEIKLKEKINLYLKLFEPISILIIAIIVGGITLSIMLPLFNIQEIII